ncbi:hypothetical protein B0H11DRAFT_1935475 [Mycena galericulata]|nr:hypothetical protein B0H11DRAFT_1935475 [Mycena galericulata]
MSGNRDVESAFVVPNVLISAGNAVIPIANVSKRPRTIHKGEIIGTLVDPETFFDTVIKYSQTVTDWRWRQSRAAKQRKRLLKHPGRIDATAAFGLYWGPDSRHNVGWRIPGQQNDGRGILVGILCNVALEWLPKVVTKLSAADASKPKTVLEITADQLDIGHDPESHRNRAKVRKIQAENLHRLLNAETPREWWQIIRSFTDTKPRDAQVTAEQLRDVFKIRLNPPADEAQTSGSELKERPRRGSRLIPQNCVYPE